MHIVAAGDNDAQSVTDDGQSAPSTAATATVTATQWTRPLTLLLLDLYKAQQTNFNRSDRKKKCVWQAIASEINSKGYTVTWDACEKKFRNMSQTYRNIKDSNSKTGRGRRYWEYMDYFDSLLADKATVTLSNIRESQLPQDEVGDVGEDLGEKAQNTEEDAPYEIMERGTKRKKSFKSTQVLKRLEHVTELEEKKIDVMKKLSDTIRESTDRKIAAMDKLTDTMQQLMNKL